MFKTLFRNRLLLLSSTTVLLLFSSALSARAQVEQGSFVGRITDPSGAAIVGATITARNVDTGLSQKAQTNSTGDYDVTPVLAGNYILTVDAAGFQIVATKRIEIQVGQVVREDLPLKVGSSTAVVEVDTTAPLLATDSATMSDVITNRQVMDLPLNGRGYYQLAQLTPGAALLPPTGNTLAIRPETVNGKRNQRRSRQRHVLSNGRR